MRFDQRNQPGHIAGLSAQARRAFTGVSASIKTSEKAGGQRQVHREAFKNRTSSVSQSGPDKKQSQLKAAADFSLAQHDFRPDSQTSALQQPATHNSPHTHSTAAELFQHFLESDHVRDEEIRLFLRRDRAVGVAAMVFFSLAAEGLSGVSGNSLLLSGLGSKPGNVLKGPSTS